MTDVSTPRRATDPPDVDYSQRRRQITGDEVRLGWGQHSLTLRGTQVIQVVGIIALLGAAWLISRESTRAFEEIKTLITVSHREAETSLRLMACVLTMSDTEKTKWRETRGDGQIALAQFCPGLLLPPRP